MYELVSLLLNELIIGFISFIQINQIKYGLNIFLVVPIATVDLRTTKLLFDI